MVGTALVEYIENILDTFLSEKLREGGEILSTNFRIG